jgi:probable phosphoglycerate mutase
MTRFFLIRHASTEANGVRLSGRADGVHLDDRGHRQARMLAGRFADVPVAAVYASPLERAVETAEPIASVLGLQVALREDFLEVEFGRWTNRGFAELADAHEFRRFNEFRSCAPVPDGEFMLQAQARMVAGLDRLRAAHPDESVVVVSHGDMIRAAIAHYAGISLDLFQRLEIGLASVSVMDLDDRTVRILLVNDGGSLGALAPPR